MVYETENMTKVRRAGRNGAYTPEAVGLAGHRLHPMLHLQQQAGNLALQELLRSGLIQAKLTVSQSNDPEERQADQIADRIMRSHAGLPAASPCSCAAGGEMCEECQQKQSGTVARKPTSTANTAAPHYGVEHILRSPGQALDAATRAFFEPHFGKGLGDVRIHVDSHAAAASRSINALAFTLGRDITFAEGQYQPGTVAGQRLLAHELAHVVQQSGTARIMRQSDPNGPTNAPEDGGSGIPLNQGQADGRDLKEACLNAKEDCKSKLNCPPDRLDIDKTCSCFKGGTFGENGYTCFSQCRCKAAKIPVS